MREILFRGKRVDNGEWIYGVPITDKATGDAYIITSTAGAYLRSEINNMCATGFRAIPETVGQYTGLKDKNGTRIFEGDILIYEYDGEYDPDEKYLVAWDNDEAAFRVNYYLKGEYIHYESITPHQYFEIIGNIYDNPELLKGD